MVRMILNKLRPTELPPVTHCIGNFSKENMRARILEVRDAMGFKEHWIDVDHLGGDHQWSSIGLLRISRLDQQLDVLTQAQEYLRKLSR